jgi:Family of unknown function (DUF6188)
MCGSTPTDLAFLNGREMVQVAIGVYQVIFAFDEEVTISVEYHFRYVPSSGSYSDWKPGAKDAGAPALELLGSKVEQAQVGEDGTLELALSGGQRLVITSEDKGQESYHITRRGEMIVR